MTVHVTHERVQAIAHERAAGQRDVVHRHADELGVAPATLNRFLRSLSLRPTRLVLGPAPTASAATDPA